MKFVIFGGGDRSVGIPTTESTITIDDNYTWDENMIKQFKEFISEFYDNGKLTILTEKEYNNMEEMQK